MLEGHCFERDLHYPYALIIDVLRAFLALQPASVVAEKFGVLGVELVKLVPELVLLIPNLQPSPALDLESEKRRLFEALLHFLIGLTQRQVGQRRHDLWHREGGRWVGCHGSRTGQGQGVHRRAQFRYERL
jgi:hypothetical protein